MELLLEDLRGEAYKHTPTLWAGNIRVVTFAVSQIITIFKAGRCLSCQEPRLSLTEIDFKRTRQKRPMNEMRMQ